MNRMPTYLDLYPMTRQQVCICCHVVRGCKGCCKACLAKGKECNLFHDCEHDVNPEGMDSTWWNSVMGTFSEGHIFDPLPEHLRTYLKKMRE